MFLPAVEAELKRLNKKFKTDIYIYRAGNNSLAIIFDKLPPSWQQQF